ncbi:Na+/H+ antiporter NhaA [Sphingomonas sp. BIUV-7]|uniref:Na(+)/H(+) antiporter NhaA n=1 Tax=Sphingomonas natans TaxID=3063330 RepID=A0ABT8YC69_9SPHN|nr:Na+/H+ antiporter NhaA [Sphingomonas sp. BIUV-7]MDO6415929.1 Na+/H+ antiporter NhaA [Sphingomonas sp. BIUV-7]
MAGRQTLLPAFVRGEAAGGIALIAAAILALLVANSPLVTAYQSALHAQLGPLSLAHWINDGLMALFFLLVGLEVKREALEGALSTGGARVLPVIAAAAGMIVPALVYLGFVLSDPALARGWAIPAATDIAFAQAVLLLAGRHVPPSLRLFLTTVAIVDDIGAVLIIAFGYTAAVDPVMLAAAAAIFGVMLLLNRRGIDRLWPYLLLAALLWVAVYRSGVHATVAGVLAALTIPLRGGHGSAPLPMLEHRLHPWVAFAIVPLFGFANAGLSLSGLSVAKMAAPLPLAVAMGLFLGKQVGIGLGTFACLKLRLAPRPEGASGLQLYGVALLAGIGFTMSLFVGGLAFGDGAMLDEVKLGVLAGSFLSAIAGFLILRFARPLPAG